MYCAYETEEGTVRLKCSKDHENRIVMHSSLECVIAERIFQKNSVPTLCIFGRHSFVIDEPGVLTSIKSNPQNKLVYAKGGHMFPLENIEDASLQIVKYLPYVDQKRLISKL
ncbi:hypothetical protein BY458DRAFT_3865 [Sporodiniella umbellata]|nr:hypothetical protein BY458DRAFT_3865 [Sporodiniella umbellata]